MAEFRQIWAHWLQASNRPTEISPNLGTLAPSKQPTDRRKIMSSLFFTQLLFRQKTNTLTVYIFRHF